MHRPRRTGPLRHPGPLRQVGSLPILHLVQRLSGAIPTDAGIGYVSVSIPLRLRPLEIGDLLDETFRMYRRHFLLFAGISVILAVPSAALFGLALAWFSTGLQTTSDTSG